MTNAATAINFDGNLTTSDYCNLEARWINRELADTAMLRRVDSLTGREIVGRKSGNYAGIAIPFVHPIAKHIVEQCIRRDEPDIELHHDGGKEVRKYVLPPGSKNRIYFPPGVAVELLTASDVPLIVTEGQFKVLALWRLATGGVESVRFLPLGLTGVWNWRGVIGKTTWPNGGRRDVKGVISDLDLIQFKERRVIHRVRCGRQGQSASSNR
jgi:hypothetical protein